MKPVIKNVSIGNDNEELVAFSESVDFTELFEHIKAFMGIDCEFYQPEITARRSDVYIGFVSKDITNQTGAFAAILERCYLHSFANGVSTDKATDEPFYWVSVSIAYEHKDGGSNGMEVVRANYRNGGWTFLDAGQRR